MKPKPVTIAGLLESCQRAPKADLFYTHWSVTVFLCAVILMQMLALRQAWSNERELSRQLDQLKMNRSNSPATMKYEN